MTESKENAATALIASPIMISEWSRRCRAGRRLIDTIGAAKAVGHPGGRSELDSQLLDHWLNPGRQVNSGVSAEGTVRAGAPGGDYANG
nr:hypothetical protein GCM10010200_089840 [Actinomadura rugatobispora]